MTDLPIPATPQQITPEWLTEALRASGTITNAAVRSVSARTIGAGQGFTTQIARLTIEYDDAGADAPTSLIAKLPSADAEIRARMVRDRFYEREVRFYESLPSVVPLRVPECYFSASSAETGDFVLLLEDLNAAGFSRRLHFGAGNLDEVRSALREIATLHAAWWEDTRLDSLGWVPAFDDATEVAQTQYKRSWPVFLEMVGEVVPPEAQAIGNALGQHIPHIVRELSQAPRTLVHGDFRFDNILAASRGGDGTWLAVIDWQLVRRGRGAYDVAFFLPGILERKQQATVGIDLLRGYHATLMECGVQGYGFEACVRDYRLALLEVLAFVVQASAMLDFSSRRGRLMLTRLAEQLSAALIDLEAAALLPR